MSVVRRDSGRVFFLLCSLLVEAIRISGEMNYFQGKRTFLYPTVFLCLPLFVPEAYIFPRDVAAFCVNNFPRNKKKYGFLDI